MTKFRLKEIDLFNDSLPNRKRLLGFFNIMDPNYLSALIYADLRRCDGALNPSGRNVLISNFAYKTFTRYTD